MRFGTSFLSTVGSSRTWFKYFFTALAVVIIIALGGLGLFKKHLEHNWQSIALEKERDLSNEMTAEFAGYQQQTLDAIQGIVSRNELQDILTAQTSSSKIAVFEFLRSQERRDFTLELLDAHKHLYAWVGKSGASVDSSLITGQITSFVTQGPINSYLVMIVPVKIAQSGQWYVVGKRLFDVNYPISNRFINNDAFSTALTSNLDANIDFDFSPSPKPSSDSGMISVSLTSIGGKAIGFAYVPRPTLQTSQEEVQEYFDKTVAVLFVIMAVILAYGIFVLMKQISSRLVNVMMFTLLIWLLRYVMVALNVPQAIFTSSIFDPKTFASPFGFGIAKSIGDMLISAAVLLSTMFVLASNVFAYLTTISTKRSDLSLLGKFVMGVIAVALALTLCLCLRGLSATIHSAVFDSSLSYNDPRFVLPPLDLAVMLANLICISCAFILGAIVLLLLAYVCVLRLVSYQKSDMYIWTMIGALCLVVSMFFGALQSNPLTGQIVRGAILAGIIALTMFMKKYWLETARLNKSALFFTASLGALLILLPLLDHDVHEIDRAHVELLSTEIMKPSDNWLTIVVNQALDQLSNNDAVFGVILR